ncbi:colicin uptake protein TolQ [Rubripirellula tenax]|uniref:Colicin uptake protein TolQ n=1 Tax=Rubripirellula tenax TaxID=2528015 RepID=A0A5C6EQ61_9BACT|nr:MotA/TolQ/ExbB proton channel family protein [Rubripirellula tenax]TWU50765.1 colicin uptake protein TolQ [Rubripirellula tenax]
MICFKTATTTIATTVIMKNRIGFRFAIVALVFLGSLAMSGQNDVFGQGGDGGFGQIDAAEIESIMTDQPVAAATEDATPSGIDLLTLISRGGAFMIPIGIMSFLVVALAVERFVSLRRRRIIPPRLKVRLETMLDPMDQFDPSLAHQSCLDFPSPAARVVHAMLQRTGQPLADIERAATEAIEREADQHASPIRWLTLAAAATPLMGLLGTVWGMIVAFHESTTLTADRSRSEQLSEGIYTALVTTLAGLVVAIPAAMLALYLENRLIKLFHRVEQLAFNVAPGIARFAGRRQMLSDGTMAKMDAPFGQGNPPPPPPPPRTSGKARDEAKMG